MLSFLFIAALWSPAGKGLTSWHSFVMFGCVFVPSPMWYPRSVVVLIPDLCHLSYFYLAPKKKYSWMQNCSVGPLNAKEILVIW